MSAPRLILRRLSFHSADAPTAVVVFAEGLNVVTGPSDTGKSFILDAIDYMLGASELRSIHELPSYNRILLQLDLDNGSERTLITLARDLDGGRFDLFDGHIDSPADMEAVRQLTGKNDAGSDGNLSNFLLTRLGLNGIRLRSTRFNKTRALSFRDLAHISIIDETRMQSPQPPIYTSGNSIHRTVERSVFKYLLEGSDDSGVAEILPPKEMKALQTTRTELLDRVVSVLGDDLPSGDPAETQAQLTRLNATIDAQNSSMTDSLQLRDDLASRRGEIRLQIERAQGEIASLQDTYNRFMLLARQYESDLERLEMVQEGGALLSIANKELCVLCGASAEHQNWTNHQASEIVSLTEAVAAETEKTRQLAADLSETLRATRARARRVRGEIVAAREISSSLTQQIAVLDARLRPNRQQLRELLADRTKLEQVLLTLKQVQAVEKIRREFENDDGNGAAVAMPIPSAATLDAFCATVQRTLTAWRVRGASAVRVDEATADLVVGGRPRAGRGKGMRALQHAAFTIGLARYCVEFERSFVGIVVIDSPLVTYREPDKEPVFEEGQGDKQSVAELFYADLLDAPQLQIIVMENVDPPSHLIPSLNLIAFTANESHGRYGFFPPEESANEE
ncbi:hypothetical protein [Mycolicibacterium lutetiense]